MPYIGREPSIGNIYTLDDISSSFNGFANTFSLTNEGEAAYPSKLQLLISLDGVIQNPTGYSLTGNQIQFSEAPSASSNFFGIVLGDAISIGVPSENTISSSKIQTNAVTETKIADSSVTYNKLNANTAHTDRNNSFTTAQRGTIQSLGVVTSNVTLTMTDSNHYSLTSNGNFTIANPSALNAGQSGSITITSNGAFTVSWGSYWRFAGGTAPTLSATAGKIDRVDYFVQSANTIHAAASVDLLGTA